MAICQMPVDWVCQDPVNMRKRTDVCVGHQPSAGNKFKRKRADARVGYQPYGGNIA